MVRASAYPGGPAAPSAVHLERAVVRFPGGCALFQRDVRQALAGWRARRGSGLGCPVQHPRVPCVAPPPQPLRFVSLQLARTAPSGSQGGRSPTRGTRRLESCTPGALRAHRVPAAGGYGPSTTMRRRGVLEVTLGFTALLAAYTSLGVGASLEAGNGKETRASRAKRRGGGGHDALKG